MPEHLPGAAQLVGLRPVLGVVDHDEIAVGELQGIVQGLGLGVRLLVRHHEGAEVAGQVQGQDCRLRLGVGGLEHQEDLELGGRVVESAQGLDKVRQHVGLAHEWHQHGVDRQQPVGVGGRLQPLHTHPTLRAGHRLVQGDQPQQRDTQEGNGDQRRQCGIGCVGDHGKAADDEPDRDGGRQHLRGGSGRPGGAHRPVLEEAADGPIDPLRLQARLQRRIDEAPRCQGHFNAVRPQRGNMAEQDIGRSCRGRQHLTWAPMAPCRQADPGRLRVRRIAEIELGIPADDGHAELVRQGGSVVVLRNPTARLQHLVGCHPAVERLGLGLAQCNCIDQRADQKRVFMRHRRGMGPDLGRACLLCGAPHPR